MSVIESVYGAPCKCGWENPLPNETLKHEWQTALCGGANCKRKFQFRGAMRPTERDPENFVIQSRPFPLRKPNGKFATTGAD
ncbi:MAG: hypothetical protein IPM41_16140 [Sphingomonadales bacterium]|jgi:hypothetical protein|nr:hypothetical protein [Sphingomonadales bacterium]